jgi:hypothetical protein
MEDRATTILPTGGFLIEMENRGTAGGAPARNPREYADRPEQASEFAFVPDWWYNQRVRTV